VRAILAPSRLSDSADRTALRQQSLVFLRAEMAKEEGVRAKSSFSALAAHQDYAL
jgi:hypothetical protein